MTEMTLAERREKMRKENAKRFVGLSAYMAQCRKEALELMRRRHSYYTKLITEAGIKTAREFFDKYREHFLMYGINLSISDDKSYCSIYLELGDYDYENYWVGDGKDDGLAEVSPEVSFKDTFNNVEVNIFTGEEL